MRVGDLVRLSTRKTRKGMPYETSTGLVIRIHVIRDTNIVIATVNFSGEVYELAAKDLRVIK